MKHYALINGKIWCNNFRCTPYRTRYIEQVARVPTPPRPVLPSPPRMGSLKIVFNRNGQWLVVIRGHYRVASRKRERGATHQPQSTSREREHRLSLCPFSLRERERERERRLSCTRLFHGDCYGSITALAATAIAAHPPNGEWNESEPNPLQQQQCVQILHGSYFDASSEHLGSLLPTAKVKPGFIPSFIFRK